MNEERGKTSIPRHIPQSFPHPTPWLFQNTYLLETDEKTRALPRNKLVNRINYLNFTNGVLGVLFTHRLDGHRILLTARPEPCLNDEITCILIKTGSEINLDAYNPDHLLLDDGLNTIVSPVSLIQRTGDRVTLSLSDRSHLATHRRMQRYPCRDIACHVTADDQILHGRMIDFSPLGLGFLPDEGALPFFSNTDQSFLVDLFDQDIKLFSGLCRCIRDGRDTPDGKMVFALVEDHIPLYAKRETRNPRQPMNPQATVRFSHPFSAKRIERDIIDLSTSGFSIHDRVDQQVLIPGMIIPELTLSFAGVTEMDCKAQVVYRHTDDTGEFVRYGLAIYDMDIDAYTKLNHLVGAQLESGACVSTSVDMDALWSFFFETDFIYGEKYSHIHPHRDDFKETYRKLYEDHPEIARHFIYQKNGTLYGHIAMVRAYDPTWIIHHFSAKPYESKTPGLLVLRQIAHYLTGFYRMRSSGLEYVMTYYRPNNKVVERIFGGFTEHLNNLKGSSQDQFSYLYMGRLPGAALLPADWSLRRSNDSDLDVLNRFYEERSGGLLLNAFRLDLSIKSLKEKFAAAGFKRNCQTLTLRYKDQPVAFFIVNQSDIGLNLSDLLNGVKCIITDDGALPWHIFESVIDILSSFYSEETIPVMIYPDDYPDKHHVDIAKKYVLWILNGSYAEQYSDYTMKKFRIRYR